MDSKGRKWNQSSGTGPAGPGGASPDDTSVTSEDQISRLTSIVTTLPSELGAPPTGPQTLSAAQTTGVQIRPEPMDLDDKPSCRFARKGDGVMFNVPGPSGEGATSASVPISPSMWQRPASNLTNTDVVSKFPSYEEAKQGNTRRPFSTPPSYPLSDRSHLSPTSRFGSSYPFLGHNLSPSPHVSQQSSIISTGSSAPSTATLSSGSSLQGGASQQSLQQDTQQRVPPERFFPDSGASSAGEGAARQQRTLTYHQQLLYVTKRLRRLGFVKYAFGRSQEAGATSLGAAQPQHNVFQQPFHQMQQLNPQRQDRSVHPSGQSAEHSVDDGSGSHRVTTSQGSNTPKSRASAMVTSDPSQAQSPHIRGFYMHQPVRHCSSVSQNTRGMPALSGMFGVQTPSQYGSAVQSDSSIRQLLQRRVNPPYPTSGTPIHQLHHQQQQYVQQQQQHHHQQEHQRRKVPLSQRLSDGSRSVKPAAVGPRRSSAPSYTTEVVMKEESGDQFSNHGRATAQLTESTQAMDSAGSEGLEPLSYVQRDLNHNITPSSNMFSTGEVCIVPPTPMNDPDAIHLAEISMGSTLLDLDLIQQQPRRFDGPSPSPFTGGFGLPPSPDTQGSFYPEQNFFPTQQMGSTIQQQGGNQISEIEEKEMVRLLMREMIPDMLEDCHRLGLIPNVYCWTPEDVQKWLVCVANRFELGELEMSHFYIDGPTLASLQDMDFIHRAPKCGDILHSVVCLLKSSIRFDAAPQVVPQAQQMMPNIPQPSHFITGAPTTDIGMPPKFTYAPVSPVATPGDESGSTGSPSDDEISIPSPAPSGPNTSMTPNHTGGIQLWQFLKELLLQPNSYSYCIRWIDRTQGIFKIEDSVEVARLWGLRKNRPAMNYDKLSRSIRQYYRKGIMKKTEVSQRLVYQFVTPC